MLPLCPTRWPLSLMRSAASARAVVSPKAKPARDTLKESAEGFYQTFWGGGEADPKPLSVSIPIADAKVTKAYLASLNPTTEAEAGGRRRYTLAGQIEQSRILMDLHVASHPASPGLLMVLTIWAIVTPSPMDW